MLKKNIKKYNYFKWILLCCGLFFVQHLVAQQASATVKKKEYLIGDWIPIDVTVSAHKDAKIYFPKFDTKDSSQNGNIEVVNISNIDTVKEGINYRYHQLVNFICFDTGKMLFEPFPVLVASGNDIDTIYTDAVLVHVAGVAIDTTKDIKPIKAPLKVPYTFKELAPFIFGALALLLLIGLVWWYLKYRKKKKAPVDLKYILPPDVWALQELDKVEKQQLWQHGDVKTYYSKLSDILRSYIELRFHVSAMEQTSDEIMKSLHRGIIKQKLKQPINDFLVMSDFVKFAKAQPDMTDNKQAMQTVKDFVEQTKPSKEKEETDKD